MAGAQAGGGINNPSDFLKSKRVWQQAPWRQADCTRAEMATSPQSHPVHLCDHTHTHTHSHSVSHASPPSLDYIMFISIPLNQSGPPSWPGQLFPFQLEAGALEKVQDPNTTVSIVLDPFTFTLVLVQAEFQQIPFPWEGICSVCMCVSTGKIPCKPNFL